MYTMRIGIDIGGSKIRIGYFANNDLFHPYKITEFKTETYDLSVIKIINSILNELGKKKKVDEIGIGIAGVINREKGLLRIGPNLKTWENRPLAHALHSKFNCRVILENDSVVAAIGEFISQSKYTKLFNVIWGTGVGGTFITKENNTLIINPVEIGHQILDPEGPVCGCGRKGCLEALIGGRAIHKLYGIDPARLTNNAIWRKIAAYAAIGIYNATIFFNPEVITFNGGIIGNRPELIRFINEDFKEIADVIPYPVFESTKLKDTAALIGAVNLAKLQYLIA